MSPTACMYMHKFVWETILIAFVQMTYLSIDTPVYHVHVWRIKINFFIIAEVKRDTQKRMVLYYLMINL